MLSTNWEGVKRAAPLEVKERRIRTRDRTPSLIEGGKGSRPLAAHFQLWSDPLAK